MSEREITESVMPTTGSWNAGKPKPPFSASSGSVRFGVIIEHCGKRERKRIADTLRGIADEIQNSYYKAGLACSQYTWSLSEYPLLGRSGAHDAQQESGSVGTSGGSSSPNDKVRRTLEDDDRKQP